MVAGVDVDLFRPDDELKKLARLAVESRRRRAVRRRATRRTITAAARAVRGRPSLARRSGTRPCEPWFNFSTGSGFYHSDKIWIQNVEVPFGYITDYIAKVKEGVDLNRPVAALHAERDRVVSEYRDLLDSDEDRAAFDGKLGLSRTVFPYVENHNFYVEHWAHSVIWRKMRELRRGAARAPASSSEVDDVFMFRRHELADALFDLYAGWAVGAPVARSGATGRRRSSAGTASSTPSRAGRRRPRSASRRRSSPSRSPSCSGASPPTRCRPGCRPGEDGDEGGLKGFAASPGLVEGPARVIFGADEIGDIQDGEILVAPLTAPSWAPVFGKIKATVTDVGGMMSHAAIVCREYGLPAVTGTAFGTKTITTGQMLRVDGNTGQVTVLD